MDTPSMNTRSWQRDLGCIAAATILLLLVPAIAMRFTREVAWGAMDFVVAAGLLFGAGAVVVFGLRHLRTRGRRWGLVAATSAIVLVVWAELAVGLFH